MSADIFKSGSILRLETVTGNIYYCMWRSSDKGLYQYRKGVWAPRKKGDEVIAKKAGKWYDAITSTMKEEFTVSEIRQEDFIDTLKRDSKPKAKEKS